MSVPLRFSTTSNFFELANSFSSPPFIVNNVPENMLVLNIFFWVAFGSFTYFAHLFHVEHPFPFYQQIQNHMELMSCWLCF